METRVSCPSTLTLSFHAANPHAPPPLPRFSLHFFLVHSFLPLPHLPPPSPVLLKSLQKGALDIKCLQLFLPSPGSVSRTPGERERVEEQQARACFKDDKRFPPGHHRAPGSLGKKLSRGSAHLLSGTTVPRQSEEEADSEGLLLSVWAAPAEHKGTTFDWVAQEVQITVPRCGVRCQQSYGLRSGC